MDALQRRARDQFTVTTRVSVIPRDPREISCCFGFERDSACRGKDQILTFERARAGARERERKRKGKRERLGERKASALFVQSNHFPRAFLFDYRKIK